jgi:hypothetical protein
MSARRVVTLALLAAAVLLERFAYYGVRALLGVYLVEEAGLGPGEVGRALTEIFVFGGLLMPLVGGTLALVLGSRLTAAIGALVAATGYALLAKTGHPVMSCLVASGGVGIFRPCTWAIAAEELSRERPLAPGAPPPLSPGRFFAVAAAAVALYAAIDVGAFAGPFLSTTLEGRWRYPAVFGAGAASDAVVSVLGLVVAVLPWLERTRKAPAAPAKHPYRAAGPVRAEVPTRLALAGAVILFAAAVPYEVGISAGAAGGTVGPMSIASSGAPFLACTLYLVAAVVGIATRWPGPLLRVFGAALVIYAFGGVLEALASLSHPGWTGMGGVITGFAEPGVAAIGIAYASLATRPRASALVVGAWISLGSALGAAGGALGAMPSLRVPVLGSAAVLAAAAGTLLVVFGRRMHQRFFS